MTIRLLLIPLFMTYCISLSQHNDCTNQSDSLILSMTSNDLNKSIPVELEPVVLYTLSYFPELQNSIIKFKYKRIKTTMNARPTLGSALYRKPSCYRYVVRLNSREMDSIIQLKHITFEALVGVFGHEFCHFVDYSR
jgi:hypothetical protein